jgi:hypothetical protein
MMRDRPEFEGASDQNEPGLIDVLTAEQALRELFGDTSSLPSDLRLITALVAKTFSRQAL